MRHSFFTTSLSGFIISVSIHSCHSFPKDSNTTTKNDVKGRFSLFLKPSDTYILAVPPSSHQMAEIIVYQPAS